jgi:hypothetical protein
MKMRVQPVRRSNTSKEAMQDCGGVVGMKTPTTSGRCLPVAVAASIPVKSR